jgi:hypothetical protein
MSLRKRDRRGKHHLVCKRRTKRTVRMPTCVFCNGIACPSIIVIKNTRSYEFCRICKEVATLNDNRIARDYHAFKCPTKGVWMARKGKEIFCDVPCEKKVGCKHLRVAKEGKDVYDSHRLGLGKLANSEPVLSTI